MEMGRKFSLYVGEAIKMSLGGFAEVDNIEATEASLYIELTKKEIRVTSPKIPSCPTSEKEKSQAISLLR